MSMPFYVSPEQLMKDRAEYAQKGIARGRSLAGVSYENGILICAQNPSRTLYKISEIYDRIAFAGAGKYNEFDQLRIAGVRHADLKGYAYSREDVDARSLSNSYAQMLGQAFNMEMKPMEVEILIAEINDETSQLFHILYDGTVADKKDFAAIGARSEEISEKLKAGFKKNMKLSDALGLAVSALRDNKKRLSADEIEAATLDRKLGRRTFRRLEKKELQDILKS